MADSPVSVDVLVVGARVGGVFTAGGFARRGCSVLLVDRATFPSGTLSTHFYRGGGVLGVAQRLGWLPAVEALGSPRLTAQYWHTDGGVQLGPPQLPGEVGYCLAARRVSLDAALLDAATREQSVTVRAGVGVSGLVFDGPRVAGAELFDGTEVRCRLVVGADGRRSKVARWVDADVREEHRGNRALYFRYVSGFEPPRGATPDGPEFSLRGDQMAYVFPSDAGLTCVALSVNLGCFETLRHDASTEWDSNLRQHEGVWDRYRRSRPESRTLGAAPQPDWVRQAAGPGWALVGDAAIHQDPWSGAGMDAAARQGELLADVVADAWAAGHDEWAGEYETRRDALLLDDFRQTVAAARDLSVLAS